MKVEGVKPSKKWIAVLSALVLVAIVVTLVIVFLPKDPKRIINEVQDQTQTMFLQENGQENQYVNLQKKVKSALPNIYDKDTENVYLLLQSLNKTIEFYSFPLAFVEDGKVLQDRYGDVVRGLNDADSAQEEMESLVKVELGDQDSSFIDGVWKDFKKSFVKYFSAYTKVIDGLSDIYQNCIPQGQTVNDFSILAVNTLDLYLQSIDEQLQKDVKATQNPDEANIFTTLAQNLAPRVNYLAKFVQYFDRNKTVLSKDPISEYNFSADLQQKVELINSFEQECNMTVKEVIDGIDQNGLDGENGGNVYKITISFLKGELE